MRVVLKGIHKVKKRLASGDIKIHYYAWRGGPAIHAKPGTPEFVRAYNEAHTNIRQPRAGTLMTIIAEYKASPEFTRLAQSTRRSYSLYIALIENEFGDLPLSALADRRVRGEFKTWRDGFAATPRKADFAWTVLARIMSFAKDRGTIATNPCEKGGRLYVADRADKLWGEQEFSFFRQYINEIAVKAEVLRPNEFNRLTAICKSLIWRQLTFCPNSAPENLRPERCTDREKASKFNNR